MLNSCGPDQEAPGVDKSGEPGSGEKAADPNQAYLGLPLKEAEALADKEGHPHRVLSIDGKSNPVTADFIPDRLNFEVEDGKVVKVTTG